MPSGKIIIEVPFLSFLAPSLITFFMLLYFLALLRWIGFKHANAHPNTGINNKSFYMMLEDGIKIVCK